MVDVSLQDAVRLSLLLLSCAFMLVFAGVLLWLDFNRTTHRVFALFLMFRAGATLLGLARGGFFATGVAESLLGYFLLPIVPLLLYFASIYPRRRGWLGTSRFGGWVVLAVVAALEVLYFLDHDLLWTLSANGGYGAFSSAGPGLQYIAYGPLQLVAGLLYPSYGIVALILAREYVAAPKPTHSLLLVVCGFLFNGLFDGTSRVTELASLLSNQEAYPWWPWGWARALLPATTILFCLAAIGVLLRSPHPAGSGILAKRRVLLPLCLLPPASALAVTLLTQTSIAAASVPGYVLLGAWRLVIPALVSYALLRYQLFDIDVKARIAITDATLVALFLVLFFALDQTLQLMLSEISVFVALAESATMALMAGRLQRIASRIASRLMPQAKRLREMTEAERLQAYRERYEMALEDGSLTKQEAAMLRALASRLGLSPGGAPVRPVAPATSSA